MQNDRNSRHFRAGHAFTKTDIQSVDAAQTTTQLNACGNDLLGKYNFKICSI